MENKEWLEYAKAKKQEAERDAAKWHKRAAEAHKKEKIALAQALLWEGCITAEKERT